MNKNNIYFKVNTANFESKIEISEFCNQKNAYIHQ